MQTLEMNRNIRHISSGVNFHYIKNTKFKTNIITIMIRNNLNRESVTKNALLAQVLKQSSKKYNKKIEIVRKLENMYGSVFDVSILKKGDEQIIFFYLEIVSHLENKLLDEGFSFLNEILLNPLADGESFSKEIVEREKKNLRSKIKERIDNKQEYASSRLIEEMYKNEPFGLYGDGYEEDIDKIDAENLFIHYKKIINSSKIEIILSGEFNEDKIDESIISKFNFERKNANETINDNSYLKNNDVEKGKEVFETKDINQSKLCIGFKTDLKPKGKDFYSMLLFNQILGGGADSKLFSKVREENGLCYYINSIVYRYKMMVLLQAGIEKKDYKKVLELVFSEIDGMKKGNITNKELENAKNALLKRYSETNDYQNGIIDFYINEYFLGTDETIESFKENIKKISKEDIVKSSEFLKKDTIYFLSGK